MFPLFGWENRIGVPAHSTIIACRTVCPAVAQTKPFMSRSYRRGQDIGGVETRPFHSVLWLKLSPGEVRRPPIAGVALGRSRPATPNCHRSPAQSRPAMPRVRWVFYSLTICYCIKALPVISTLLRRFCVWLAETNFQRSVLLKYNVFAARQEVVVHRGSRSPRSERHRNWLRFSRQ